jgi:hypothetical protein
LRNSELYLFLKDALSNILKAMVKMVNIFSELRADSYLNVSCIVVAAAGIHNGDPYFKDENPNKNYEYY